MQKVVIDKPYHFVPPQHGSFWPMLMRTYLPGYLGKSHGIESCEYFGIEKLKASLNAGHGIMLAPNHCRPCDPMVVGLMLSTIPQPVYIMASSHLFMQHWLLTWLLPRLGVFSMHREGLDRDSLKCAVDILVKARRPLVIFPEGAISRTNDRLNPLMDGTAFIARNAAKQRKDMDPPGKVVIHPVAIRYFFCGNPEKSITPVLEDIEARLSWQPQKDKSLVDRIIKAGEALLTLKELEYAEKPRGGTLAERVSALIDQLLAPLENEWLKGKKTEGNVTARVKALRTAILPDMVACDMPEEERARRWRQLADIYLAQQLFFYPPDYFSKPPTPEQLLETVERFEEDLTDTVRVHRPVHVAIEIGDAIEVSPARERGAEADPVMTRLRADIDAMLIRLKEKRPRSITSGRTGGPVLANLRIE